MRETKFRTCNLCEAMCGMAITLEDGAVVDLRGDPEDVFSRGHICPKGPAMRELQEDPDRLRYPVRKTSSGFSRVSWDEALDETSTRLAEIQAKSGESAVGIYFGNPSVHNHGALLMAQLLISVLHTRNKFDANSQDANPRIYGSMLMFGDTTALTVPDVDRTDYFLVLGANPLASNGSIMTLGDVRGRLKAIRERGGKMILIDPRRTETASICDEHHAIVPGGDAALLLAMLHVIFDEGLEDKAALATMTEGEAALRAAAKGFSPERVAAAIGIEATTIRRLAKEFAAAKRAVAYSRVGVSVSEFGPVASWLVEALNLATGNFDRAGGSMFTTPAVDLSSLARKVGVNRAGRYRTRVRGLPELAGMLPAAAIAEEIETEGEGQIRAFVTLAGNPVLSVPSSNTLDRALAKLDFMVSVDLYVNETTRHANLILPPRGVLERGHYDLVFHALAVRNTAKWSDPVLPPSPDSRDDGEILRDLAARLLAKKKTRNPLAQKVIAAALMRTLPKADTVIDALLRLGPYGDRFLPFGEGLSLAKLRKSPHGVDLGPLVPSREKRVRRPSAKVDIAPEPLLADLPRLDQWLDRRAEGGLLLIGRRHVRSNNSWMHNIHSLVKGPDRTALLMHPDDATRLGLTPGCGVSIASRAGAVTTKLAVTTDMMKGVVSLPHGFGHGLAEDTLKVAGAIGGPNANAVTDGETLEPLTGTAILNGVPVAVTRADQP